MRGLLIAQLHVLCRLRGDGELQLQTADELTDYLSERCDGLLGLLQAEWWDGWEPGCSSPASGQLRLREMYTKAMQTAWLRAGVVG